MALSAAAAALTSVALATMLAKVGPLVSWVLWSVRMWAVGKSHARNPTQNLDENPRPQTPKLMLLAWRLEDLELDVSGEE